MKRLILHILLICTGIFSLQGQVVDSTGMPVRNDLITPNDLIFTLPPPGRDQEAVLPPVLIREERLDQLPGAPVTQLDAHTLADHANGDLGSALAGRTAVFIKNYGPGALATPSFRGTGAGHTQLYWDGIPLNSPTLGLQDMSLFPMGLFDNARLYLGGSNLILGSGGLGGAVDLGQYQPVDSRHRAEVKLRQEVGSFGTWNTGLGVGLKLSSKVQSRTRLWHRRSQNNYLVPMRGNELQPLPHAKFAQSGFLQQVQAKLSRLTRISGRFWYHNSERQLPGVIPDFNSRQAQADRAFRSLVEVWTGGAALRFNIKAAHFFEETLYTDTLADIKSLTQSHSGFFESNVHFKRLGFGILPKAGLRLNIQQARSEGFPEAVDRVQASAFARAEAHVHPSVLLSVLLRQEWVDNGFTPFLPSIGLEWNPGFLKERKGYTEKIRPLRLGINANRNFRLPSLNDLYWFPGGNPDLRPEISETIEASAEGFVPFQGAENAVQLKLSTYAMHIRDLIQWIPDSTALWSARNVREVFSRGGEAGLNVKGKIGRNELFFRSNYALTLSQSLVTDNEEDPLHRQQLIYVPIHNGNLGLRLTRKKWYFDWEQQFAGSRSILADGSETLPAFSLSNVRLGRSLTWKKVAAELQLRLDNLFNSQYQVVVARPMPGRSITGRLSFDLGLTHKK